MSDSAASARIKAFVRALLPKDWSARAGERFRRTVRNFAAFTSEYLHLKERARELPDLGWKAVEGTASEKHARALLDYAKEESEKVDQQLKRRTLTSKVRQEEATAAKLEAEARISTINEIKARLDLLKELQKAGALPVLTGDGVLRVISMPDARDWPRLANAIISEDERRLIEGLTDVRMPSLRDFGTDMTLTRWIKRPGDDVERDEPIFEVSTPLLDSEIPCPISGVLVETLVSDGASIEVDQVVARVWANLAQF